MTIMIDDKDPFYTTVAGNPELEAAWQSGSDLAAQFKKMREVTGSPDDAKSAEDPELSTVIPHENTEETSVRAEIGSIAKRAAQRFYESRNNHTPAKSEEIPTPTIDDATIKLSPVERARRNADTAYERAKNSSTKS